MSAVETTQVTITVPVVKAHDTANTVRFYEADSKGKPNKSGTALWMFTQLLEQAGIDRDVSDLTVTITGTKTKPGILIDGKTVAEVEKAAKAAAKAQAKQAESTEAAA